MEQIKDLLKQIKKQPDRPDLHNSVGRLYQQQGNKVEASNHFLAAARMYAAPESVIRNVHKAIAILKKTLRDFPDIQDSYYLLAELYDELDNQKEAVEIYQALSDYYITEGKTLMAVSVYDKVISLEPDNQQSWVDFAELNRDAGMPFHAAQAFIKAASLGMGAEMPIDSDKLLLDAMRLDPENAESLEMLKNMAHSGKFSEELGEDLFSIIESLVASGQFDSAMNILKVLEGSPFDEMASGEANKIREITGATRSEQEVVEVKSTRSGKFAGTKVLIVDDEREILLLLEQILQQEGFNVLTAMDGEEGYKTFIKEKPPLVVSDAMLPKLHGFELCSSIKEVSDHKVKVMILTAVYKKYKYKGKVQEEYHVDEYLDKPFQITEFLDTFYRMAEDISDEIQLKDPEVDETLVTDDEFTIMVAGSGERELVTNVEYYCESHDCNFVTADHSSDIFIKMQDEIPDILLLTEKLPGMDPFVAAKLVRNLLEVRSTTIVLISRDPSLLEGDSGEFNHRIAGPASRKTLSAIVKLHEDSKTRIGLRRYDKVRSINERHIDAVVKSKVERVLKNHNQLEEYYNTRIKELETEIEKLRVDDGEVVEK